MVNTAWWYAYRGRDICMQTTIIPWCKEMNMSSFYSYDEVCLMACGYVVFQSTLDFHVWLYVMSMLTWSILCHVYVDMINTMLCLFWHDQCYAMSMLTWSILCYVYFDMINAMLCLCWHDQYYVMVCSNVYITGIIALFPIYITISGHTGWFVVTITKITAINIIIIFSNVFVWLPVKIQKTNAWRHWLALNILVNRLETSIKHLWYTLVTKHEIINDKILKKKQSFFFYLILLINLLFTCFFL